MCADNASVKARKAFGWLRIRLKGKNNSEKQHDIATTGTAHLLSKGLRLVTCYKNLSFLKTITDGWAWTEGTCS